MSEPIVGRNKKTPPAKRLPPLLLMLLGGFASWMMLLWIFHGRLSRIFGFWLLGEVIPAALIIAGFRRALREESRPVRWTAGLLLLVYVLALVFKLLIFLVLRA